MSMLELLCPTGCGERCSMTEQVQTDDRVTYTGECSCGCWFEREDKPGEIVVTKKPAKVGS